MIVCEFIGGPWDGLTAAVVSQAMIPGFALACKALPPYQSATYMYSLRDQPGKLYCLGVIQPGAWCEVGG